MSNSNILSQSYVSVLPEQKTSNIKSKEKITLFIDPMSIPFFNGVKSYLNVGLRAVPKINGTYSGDALVTSPYTTRANMGANGILQRVVVKCKETGKILEDIDQYNLMKAVLDAHRYDSYDYQSLTEDVRNSTPCLSKDYVSNTRNNKLTPWGQHDPTNPITYNYCLPLEIGLLGGLGNMEKVVPNLLLGGLEIELYLDKPENVLCFKSHVSCTNVQNYKFPNSANAEEFYRDRGACRVLDGIYEEELPAGSLQTSTLLCSRPAVADVADKKSLLVDRTVFNPDVELALGYYPQDWTYEEALIGLDIGNVLRVKKIVTPNPANPPVTVIDTEVRITNIGVDDVGGTNYLRLYLDKAIDLDPATDDAIDGIRVSLSENYKPDYVVDMLELKVLKTDLSQQAQKQVRDTLLKEGMRFHSVQLTKVSSPPVQDNVIQLPAVVKSASSILVCPVQNSVNNNNPITNKLIYPEMPSNDLSYQFQIRGTLIPQREVRFVRNGEGDLPIYYSELEKALTPFCKVKRLAPSSFFTEDGPVLFHYDYATENVDETSSHNVLSTQNPNIFGLQLAVDSTSSFNLQNTEPQLRIFSQTLPSLPTLFYIYTGHYRHIKIDPNNGVMVDY